MDGRRKLTWLRLTTRLMAQVVPGSRTISEPFRPAASRLRLMVRLRGLIS